MKKVGKKIQLDNFKNYKIHFGTMDKRTTNTFYMSISSWVKPKVETTLDYEKVLRKLKKKIKDYIYTNLDVTYFNNKFIIVDLDLRTSGIKYGKKSFMNCEVTIYKRTDEKIDTNNFSTKVNQLVGGLTKNVLEKNEYFSFNKTKK